MPEATSQVATRIPDDTEPFDAGVPPLFGTELRIATTDDSEARSVDSKARSVDPEARFVDFEATSVDFEARSSEFEARCNEPGEILVRGGTVMAGYLNLPRESAETLRGGWLHTGDIGTLDERGRLRVLDRRDDLIVSGGENIYPSEVEKALCLHPAVVEAGVAAVPDAAFGNRPAAWLVVSDAAPSNAELEAFCRKRLAGYKVPVAFRTVEALPRTASGKLLRRNLASSS